VEALCLAQRRQGTSFGAASANLLEGGQVPSDDVHVRVRRERVQAAPVELNPSPQEAPFFAKEENASVDELLALYTGHHPDNGVVK
jgi:hypothetical protein